MRKLVRPALALTLIALSAAPAAADVPPPPDEVTACQNKRAGDTCSTGNTRRGTCQRVSWGRGRQQYLLCRPRPAPRPRR